jgi:hypothetical protein
MTNTNTILTVGIVFQYNTSHIVQLWLMDELRMAIQFTESYLNRFHLGKNPWECYLSFDSLTPVMTRYSIDQPDTTQDEL